MDTLLELGCACRRGGDEGPPEERADSALGVSSLLAIRQIRHQTKNALQRIIAQIDFSNLRATCEGRLLAEDVERRILLSAQISDALFGLTEQPARLADRLHWLGGGGRSSICWGMMRRRLGYLST